MRCVCFCELKILLVFFLKSLRLRDATYVSVNEATIESDDGWSPVWHQAIIWTNAGILSHNGPLGTNLSGILIEIQTFSFKKMCFKMLSARWQPFCLSLNVLIMPVYHIVSYWMVWWWVRNSIKLQLISILTLVVIISKTTNFIEWKHQNFFIIPFEIATRDTRCQGIHNQLPTQIPNRLFSITLLSCQTYCQTSDISTP